MRIPPWMFLLGLVAFIGMTGICSFASYTIAREFVIDTRASGVEGLPSFQQFVAARPTPTPTLPPPTATHTPPPGVTFTPQPTSEAAPTEDTTSAQDILAADDPLAAIDAWNDPGRVTILVMGIDQRTATSDRGPFRTDTMILVQIDPINGSVGVLSIPRDLWVDIPGYSYGRVTQANYIGDQAQLPQGGPGLAMETIYRNLGVGVDYYVRINFEVFLTVVDTLAPNGVEVCPQEEIIDDKYPDEAYGFISVRFEPGCQTLQAERLLQYARTRATQGSDFDRNQRQQEVMRGLQEEILSAGGVLNFVTQIPVLYTELAGSYVTDLRVDEILSLALLGSEVSQEDVTYKAINNLHVEFATTEEGDQILIPIQDRIRQVVQEAFDPVTDLTVAEMRERAAAEEAEIVVYNNTTISGLAGQTREWLTSREVTVAGVGNIEPPSDAAEIVIRDYTGNTWTTRYLAELMGLPSTAIRTATDGLTSADVMVVVGSDVQSLLGSASP